MLQRAKDFVHDQRGATALEYALIASLIFMAIIVGVQGVANKTVNMFTNIQNSV